MEFEPQQSKSRIKRNRRALQLLGRELAALPEKNLVRLPLSAVLFDAVREARSMDRGARQRQLRYIGGLLAREDVEAIREALRIGLYGAREAIQRFHEVEKWRDALLEGGDETINDFLLRFPSAERAQLRQLVRNARKEQRENRPPKSTRLLFRYLRDLLDAVA